MYLEIDEGFPEHPKTLQLCASMQSPTAFAYLINFWKWACRCCPDGDLRGISVYAIEEAARYYQHDGKLFQSMAARLGSKAGFIDVDDTGAPSGIHNWNKRTGAAIKRMEDEAERKRLYRAHKEKKCGQGCKWCEMEMENPSPVRGKSDGHPQDIPTQTRPDQTRPDQTRPGDPPARDPGTTDTESAVPPPEQDRPFLPDTPDRLVACIKAAVEKARPERGFWDPGAKGSFVHQDAAEFLRGLGDIDFVAPEVMRRIQLFAKDDRMAPWTFAKFRREYNGIGVERQPNTNGNRQTSRPVDYPKLG